MAEVMLSKEKMDFTIDLLITMTVEEIAEETGKARKDVLIDFLSSKTGKAYMMKRPDFGGMDRRILRNCIERR